MTNLKKPVKRVSGGKVFEAGKWRSVVVILEPPSLLKFRAKGCKKTYALTSSSCYHLAVKAHVLDEKKRKAAEKRKHGTHIKR